MFSSLASFLFGSNTSSTTISETNHNPIGIPEQGDQQQQIDAYERIDAENTIELTSSTPSVPSTGTNNNALNVGKRGKNRRAKYNKTKKGQRQPTPAITKLLTPCESTDDDCDDDDWFIVEKEDEEDSLPRTDSEEDLSIVEVKSNPISDCAGGNAGQQQQQQRQRPGIHTHSLYSGPRPQQQRNYRQRILNSGARGGALNVSRLSPHRSIGVIGAGTPAADGGLTQSLYVVSQGREGYSGSDNENGANAMEESWFVTPPPCFTSIGPINMETSPFENLLIEHPSMSVYHSIRSAQEATESFVDLDLGVNESQQQRCEPATAVVQTQNGRNGRAGAVQRRAAHVRVDRYNNAQLKQELFARSAQKSHDKRERQHLCRGAIKRANKVRDVQSRANPQRRSDMQHCKIASRANNNRKCCY